MTCRGEFFREVICIWWTVMVKWSEPAVPLLRRLSLPMDDSQWPKGGKSTDWHIVLCDNIVIQILTAYALSFADEHLGTNSGRWPMMGIKGNRHMDRHFESEFTPSKTESFDLDCRLKVEPRSGTSWLLVLVINRLTIQRVSLWMWPHYDPISSSVEEECR